MIYISQIDNFSFFVFVELILFLWISISEWFVNLEANMSVCLSVTEISDSDSSPPHSVRSINGNETKSRQLSHPLTTYETTLNDIYLIYPHFHCGNFFFFSFLWVYLSFSVSVYPKRPNSSRLPQLISISYFTRSVEFGLVLHYLVEKREVGGSGLPPSA